ncbi:nucleolar protein 8 [Erpetoichthys calabaricus]|uniref:Nucleolar protein 8 n=1 Tax=Erpetoichthys calabaricus TaxID=27687 RepID=A0A8C4TBC2_ERPCA|nr:nucleolar protein 8 [Erpetoichthys calabaricus]XP_051777382.1 nucleolar protein 8 [Erpetoichthys calabaricus]XP_051777383.1 nucleolar protein 8 [Erpetoichthys calabaricus]
MDLNKTVKRLYVGGLNHRVTEKELQQRFGKFGDVSDVQIITRKDNHGIPVKTFGYLNITTTTAELHKCMSVLNKTKWKGETLQIEMAKESFLQRLCEEQKQSVVVKQSFHSDTIPQFMESLKMAGVENFHMKAAVPGSEVPGHKKWVVGKFGRVLPVLHLKARGQNKILKYDPSKHCHGIRNLDQEADYNHFTPISKLTWFFEEADGDISRKRQGEFPIPKKKRKGITEDFQRKNFADLKKSADNPSDIKGTSRAYFSNPVKAPNQRQENGSWPRFTSSMVHDIDVESEEEIKRMVAKENKKYGGEFCKANDDLEVVDSDFSVMYNSHKNNETNRGSLVTGLDPSRGYDSADTDEIITFNKANFGQIKQKVEPAVPTTSRDVTKKTPSKEKSKKRQFEMRKAWSSMKCKTAETCCSSEDSESSVDSDYEAMMHNSCRVDLTLTEMETLAKINEREDKVDFKWLHNDSVKQICTPEEILESLIGDDSSEDESKWTKRNGVVQELPSFKGTRILSKSNQSAQCYTEDSVTNFQSVSDVSPFGSEACKKERKKIFCKDGIFHAESSCEQREEVFVCNSVVSKDCQTITNLIVPSSGVLSSECPGKGFREKKQLAYKKNYHSGNTEETMPWSSCSSSSHNTNAEKRDVNSTMSKSSCVPPKKEIMSKSTMDTHSCLSQTMNPNVTNTVKQQQDNLRRMAALMQREKEASLQKTQIRLALSNLDSSDSGNGKHIFFKENNEEEAELQDTEKESQQMLMGSLQTVVQAEKKSPTKLFENTEDEENDKDDDGRFQLKAHFEGKAGQKLMRLQSHFGTDERFRMDCRFLESEDEQDVAECSSTCSPSDAVPLAQEKQRNLEILQNLLHIDTQSAKSVKNHSFRNVSSLHYDPSQEDHVAIEASATTDVNQNSKPERHQKCLETEMMQNVTKEIYYEITANFKETFGSSKEREDVPWDEKDEGLHLDPTEYRVNTVDKSPGFTFSFFGEDTVDDIKANTESYKIETIKASKLSWMEDPRFIDSSSDEMENEEEGGNGDKMLLPEKTQGEQFPARKSNLFFFFKGDERLQDGPEVFCRTGNLEDQREQWEAACTSLREEYRKKHKDAKRKMKLRQSK